MQATPTQYECSNDAKQQQQQNTQTNNICAAITSPAYQNAYATRSKKKDEILQSVEKQQTQRTFELHFS